MIINQNDDGNRELEKEREGSSHGRLRVTVRYQQKKKSKK